MRGPGRRLTNAALVAACLIQSRSARAATPYEQRPVAMRALYTGVAVVANVVPGVSALYAPRCLPGYVLCKLAFAGLSVVAAGDQFFFAGDADLAQTRAILDRGFGGDWFLTGRDVTGEHKAEPLPEPPPPAESGGWQPPPL